MSDFDFMNHIDDKNVVDSAKKFVISIQKYKGPNGKTKSRQIKCWYNNMMGTNIINAESGNVMDPYGSKVGSAKEELFYKIKHCGLVDKPVTLYYYSKTECINHLGL